MKERYFWLIMVVIVIAWIGNYTYLKSQQLENPILLTHYYEIPFEDRSFFEIYYLTNKDHQKLNYLELNGVGVYPSEEFNHFVYEQNVPQFEKEFRHHYLKKVRFELRDHGLPLEPNSGDKWSVQEVIPHYTHVNAAKRPESEDVGNISVKAYTQGNQLFGNQMSGSSNTNETYHSATAQENVLIEKLVIPHHKKIADSLDIKIGVNDEFNLAEDRRNWSEIPGKPFGEIAFPIQLMQGDTLSIYLKVDDSFKSYLHMPLRWVGKTEDGESFENLIFMNSQPRFDQDDINQIIAEKEEGME
ncbi:hypothetical protein ACSVDE_01660 [Pseudalkalibacillus sp. Hm43]|uniref:hypothetical protein n=1 Tax=Pseudalkalibacillus sp. Hm43 TaxID=3450742 RepID=UPI003F425C67